MGGGYRIKVKWWLGGWVWQAVMDRCWTCILSTKVHMLTLMPRDVYMASHDYFIYILGNIVHT